MAHDCLNQISGGLIGQCLADALATPVRGSSRAICEEYRDQHLARWLTHNSLTSLPDPLYYTEGSQLTFELLACLLDGDHRIAQRFLAKTATLMGRGWLAQRYLETHLAVKAYRTTGIAARTATDSVGFGSIHRSAAPALCYYLNREKARTVATLQSELTHRNPLCSAGSAVVADWIAAVIRRELGPTRMNLDLVIPDTATSLGTALEQLPVLLGLAPADALCRIGASIALPGAAVTGELSDHWQPALLWTLYCVFHCEWNYSRAVSLAISSGGEIVGPAALVGALCGAHQGLDALPAELLQRLTNRGRPALRDLLALAERCVTAGGGRDGG